LGERENESAVDGVVVKVCGGGGLLSGDR